MELSIINESEKEQSIQNLSNADKKSKKTSLNNLAFLQEFHKIYENDRDKLNKYKPAVSQRRNSVDSNYIAKNRMSILGEKKNSSLKKRLSFLKNRRNTINLTHSNKLTLNTERKHKQSVISFNLPPKESKTQTLSPMKINDRRRSEGFNKGSFIIEPEHMLNRSNSMSDAKQHNTDIKRRSGKRSNLTLGQAVKEINKPYITFNKRNSQIGPFIKINRMKEHKPAVFRRRDSFSDYSILARGSLRLRTDYYRRRMKIIIHVIGTIAFIKNEIIKFGLEPRSTKPILEDDNAMYNENTVMHMTLIKTILQEDQKSKSKKVWYIIYPESKFIRVWSSFILTLSSLFCIYYPFRMAYTDTYYNLDWISFLVIDLLVESIYIADIIINLFTAFENAQGKVICSLYAIFINYLSSLWLIIDIVYMIPFMYLATKMFQEPDREYVRSENVIMFLLMLRVLKTLLKINEFSFVEKVRELLRVNTGIVKVIYFFVNTIILCHIFACIWYFNAVCEDFNPDTWVFRYRGLDENIGMLYLKALYFAYVVFITVGYGDILAYTNSKIILIQMRLFLLHCGCL
jgi:hypothetical protein